MSIEYGRLRTILLEFLAQRTGGHVDVLGSTIFDYIIAKGEPVTSEDTRTICQIFHDFYLERIIIAGSADRSTGAMNWPWFRVTEFGESVLKSREYQPYDPDRYLA